MALFRRRTNSRKRRLNYTWGVLAHERAKDYKGQSLGFPQTVPLEKLKYLYERDLQAHREINKIALDCFKKGVIVHTDNEKLKSEIEDFLSYFLPTLHDAFKVSLLYGYALIYKNYNDAADISEPPQRVRRFSDDHLLSFNIITPFSVQKIVIDNNVTSETYGKVKSYQIAVKHGETVESVIIDATRVIHLDYDSPPGEVTGTPYLKPAFNILTVKHNVEWAMGEAYWRHAVPLTIAYLPADADDDEFERVNTLMANINAATSFTAFEGYKFEQLGGKPVDPSAWTEYIKMACSNMPETILWGVTSGKLTGSETNIKIYYDDIKSIQRSILLPRIESMLKELQEYGLLPKGEFRIEFPPLFEESEKERAQYEFMRARAAQALAGDLNHPPILTLKEIRETLYPELPEIPEGLKEIWEKQYGFSVERQENKRLIINKLDDIERKKLLEKWLFPADKWEHAVYATALPLAYKLEDKFIKFLDKYYPIREVATESAVTKITSATNATVPVEVQEKFLKRLFGITVDHTKMKEKILPALQQTFDESADFTLEALDVPVYSLRDPDVDKWIELRAETHTWKFYENCAEKAKYAIIEGLKNGESIQAVKKRLGEIFEDKSNKDLMTLARTLTQEVVNEARMLAYQDNGIDRVIFIATLDERTCDECMNYDGKVFPVTDMPLVPVHPGCRCTWIPETVRPGGW